MKKALLIFSLGLLILSLGSFSDLDKVNPPKEYGHFISENQGTFPIPKNESDELTFISTKFHQNLVSTTVQTVTNRLVQLLSDFFKPELVNPNQVDLLFPPPLDHIEVLFETTIAAHAP
ncbi:MAG: hypothetical protein ACO263_06215 [Cyclobacteriaceae bacterium]|jgi:hypothetical protein